MDNEVLNFFTQYYYESLRQRDEFFNKLKFYYIVLIGSFSYLMWLTDHIKSLLIHINLLSIFCILFIILLTLSNFYCLYLTAKAFKTTQYDELPDAIKMKLSLENRNKQDDRIKYLINEYADCISQISNLNDKRKIIIHDLNCTLIGVVILISASFCAMIVETLL